MLATIPEHIPININPFTRLTYIAAQLCSAHYRTPGHNNNKIKPTSLEPKRRHVGSGTQCSHQPNNISRGPNQIQANNVFEMRMGSVSSGGQSHPAQQQRPLRPDDRPTLTPDILYIIIVILLKSAWVWFIFICFSFIFFCRTARINEFASWDDELEKYIKRVVSEKCTRRLGEHVFCCLPLSSGWLSLASGLMGIIACLRRMLLFFLVVWLLSDLLTRATFRCEIE